MYGKNLFLKQKRFELTNDTFQHPLRLKWSCRTLVGRKCKLSSPNAIISIDKHDLFEAIILANN